MQYHLHPGKSQPTSRFCIPPSVNNIVNATTAMTTILPLRVHTHCTAALPISAGDCRGDMGIGCIVWPVMTAVWYRVRMEVSVGRCCLERRALCSARHTSMVSPVLVHSKSFLCT
jgi:hypothetical protein